MARPGRTGYGGVSSRNNITTMNSAITFPPPGPTLKLARPSAEKWVATLTEERRRLYEDHEALREREANLRDYEARLRALQAGIEAGRVGVEALAPVRGSAPAFQRPSSRTPFTDEAALQAAWDRLHRAREILEAEQDHMRDDRLVQREREAAVKHREETVAAREAELAQREALVAAAMPDSSQPVAAEHTMSAMTRLTRTPFEMARSVFGGKR